MIRHAVTENANEIPARGQNGDAPSQIFQLTAEMEDGETEESVHRCVNYRSQENRGSLNDERQLEPRTLVDVEKVISLQRQRPARIREVRQVP